jgi:hypothetical protein
MVPPDAYGGYTEFQLFAHVVPGAIDNPVTFAGEIVKLVRHIQAVLMAAWSGPAA